MKVTRHGRFHTNSLKPLFNDPLKAFVNGSRVDCKKRLHLEALEKAQIDKYSGPVIFPWEDTA
jgi:hypothetical protein